MYMHMYSVLLVLHTITHNHTASGAGAVMTPSTGSGLDGELSAPSSFGVVGTVGPNTQSESTARMPHSLTHCCSSNLSGLSQ